jgi:hypothetical protein
MRAEGVTGRLRGLPPTTYRVRGCAGTLECR